MAKTSTATEAGQESSLREGLEAAIRDRVREIIEMVLEEEVEAALGASRSQRVAERSGYRHGAKPRRLTLRTGPISMRVPRARLVSRDGAEREWQSGLVPRYRRSSQEVEQSVLGVYLSGSNSRRIRGALEPLLSGAALSKSAVSRLVLRLEESYRTWQRRAGGLTGGAGGAGRERDRREGAAEPDDRGSRKQRRLADAAGGPGGAEDGPAAAGDQ